MTGSLVRGSPATRGLRLCLERLADRIVAQLEWGALPPMLEQGVDRGVLYLDEGAVPWNGLVSVEEKESGWIESNHYFEGNRVHISQDVGEYGARISAFTYPDVFAEYNGYSKPEARKFGFSYRTQHGDSHRIHLVYNTWVRTDARSWQTAGSTADPSLFTWDLYTSPVQVPLGAPTARIIVEAPRDPTVLERVEAILYGSAEQDPRMPDPFELVDLYEAATRLQITRHPDGRYTASGPDDMVRLLPDGRFEINSPTAIVLDAGIFTVTSY